MKDTLTISGAAHTDRTHDSAVKHVTGRADYTDDIAQPEDIASFRRGAGVDSDYHVERFVARVVQDDQADHAVLAARPELAVARVPRFDAVRAECHAVRTAVAVRLRLSVIASTITATPPGP